jgi:hypothetical protein
MDSVPATSPLEGECALLTAQVRASTTALDALLADDFFEIAATGASFGKNDVLARLPDETGVRFEADGMVERHLGEGVALVTYRAVVERDGVRQSSLRSSLWRREAAGWRMLFHQGTPLPDGDTIHARRFAGNR